MKEDSVMLEEVLKIKDEANECFKSGDFEKAISLNVKALSLCKDEETICILHKNTAASCLKLDKFNDAIQHCDKALDLKPQDPKALFRRACAYESLERFEEAYRDAQKALVSSPSESKFLAPLLSRLHVVVQGRRDKMSQTKEKALKIMDMAFGDGKDGKGSTSEEIETGLNNIIVLSRERAGIEALLELGILRKLKTLLELKKPTKTEMERKLNGVRAISQMCDFDPPTCKRILTDLGVPFMLNLMDVAYGYTGDKALAEEAMTAIQYLWQVVLDCLAGKKKDEKPNKAAMEENKTFIDSFLSTLTMSLNSHSISGEARDTMIQILTKNMDYSQMDWCEKFVEVGGVQRLCEVGSEVPELKIESAMVITENTKSLLSVLLNRIYNNMYYDQAKQRFVERVDDVVKDLLMGPDIEAKIRVTTLITVLLLGPIEVGSNVIGRQGIIQMILVMANTDDYLQQKVAVEAIVAASSKKDRGKGIINDGINILKRLYQSKNDDIKVRALVGLCKLGSLSGTDAAWKPFAEGATLKLSEACRRFLLNPAQDTSVQRWAIEGLSYLSLDGDVKAKLIEDGPAMKVLLEMSSQASKMTEVVYPIVTCLVNLCNAYDKHEIDPQMLELAKFAKHHIPEEHYLDDPDFVRDRVEALAKLGVTSCLVNLTRATESASVMELISRVINAVCDIKENRGLVVAQGGAKALLTISQKSSEKGKLNAALGLARLGITQKPSMAFPGERMVEVVKPLISLLNRDCSAIQNFEALLALCNLTGDSEACQRRIFDEKGYMEIEQYMYEDHTKLRMAATQVVCNLSASDNLLKLFEAKNDRVKFMMCLCAPSEDLDEEDVDDIETMKAASGTLAILSSASRIICGKIMTCVTDPTGTLLWLCANPLVDLQLRGLSIVRNIIEHDEELAKQLVGSQLFEVIMALATLEPTANEKLTEAKAIKEDLKKREDLKVKCGEILEAAKRWDLIKRN